MPAAAPALSNTSANSVSIAAENLHVTYRVGGQPVPVLKGIHLSVRPGEKVFLCGPSGAGKTTLLYTLGGLESPTQGHVIINGTSLYELSDSERARQRNQLMGYIFQNYLLLPELTALENVALPALIGGKQARERAAELLNKVGLGKRLDHLPTQLSGGEQQRVAIARALINDPPFLFADEPTGNLDSKTGLEVMNLLLSAVAESGKTLMVVTHDTTLAHLGDRTLILKDGLMASPE
jgi:ABC-type lipoprotein export system ATPase subunit